MMSKSIKMIKREDVNSSSLQLLNRLPLLFNCGHTIIPTLPTLDPASSTSLTTSLSMFKTQVYSSLSTTPHHTLSYCSMSVLHHLTSLLLDDHSLTGHYGNCLTYLDPTLSSLQCLPSGSLYRCAEFMAKARDSVRHRKRNINNRITDSDEIKRMNFLNRVEQLDQAMVAMREVLLISIIRQHTINRVAAPALLDSSTSSCEQDSPVMTRRVLMNNNTLAVEDIIRTQDRKGREGGLLGESEANIATGTSLSNISATEVSSESSA